MQSFVGEAWLETMGIFLVAKDGCANPPDEDFQTLATELAGFVRFRWDEMHAASCSKFWVVYVTFI